MNNLKNEKFSLEDKLDEVIKYVYNTLESISSGYFSIINVRLRGYGGSPISYEEGRRILLQEYGEEVVKAIDWYFGEEKYFLIPNLAELIAQGKAKDRIDSDMETIAEMWKNRNLAQKVVRESEKSLLLSKEESSTAKSIDEYPARRYMRRDMRLVLEIEKKSSGNRLCKFHFSYKNIEDTIVIDEDMKPQDIFFLFYILRNLYDLNEYDNRQEARTDFMCYWIVKFFSIVDILY